MAPGDVNPPAESEGGGRGVKKGFLAGMLLRSGWDGEKGAQREGKAPKGKGWAAAKKAMVAKATATLFSRASGPAASAPGAEERTLIGKPRTLERAYGEGSLQRTMLHLFSRFQVGPQTRNPKPCTLNPKPQTLISNP